MFDLSIASGYFRALVETVSVSGFSYCFIGAFLCGFSITLAPLPEIFGSRESISRKGASVKQAQ